MALKRSESQLIFTQVTERWSVIQKLGVEVILSMLNRVILLLLNESLVYHSRSPSVELRVVLY